VEAKCWVALPEAVVALVEAAPAICKPSMGGRTITPRLTADSITNLQTLDSKSLFETTPWPAGE
jgi:hypothetical protein